jgi:tetratricopeptide (TPR) repeat protein
MVGTGRKLWGGIAAVVLVFCLTIGWYRIQGEMHNVAMLKAQVAKNYAKMATEAALAANIFYEYDDVALPMPYHEGLALAHLNRIPEAEAAFEIAYWMNPWSFAVTNNYATALAQAGKLDEAIPLFEKTVAINPKSDEGKSNLAYLHMKKGDAKKAMEWYHKIDTIVKPQTEQDRLKNEQIKSEQGTLLKILQDLQK